MGPYFTMVCHGAVVHAFLLGGDRRWHIGKLTYIERPELPKAHSVRTPDMGPRAC